MAGQGVIGNLVTAITGLAQNLGRGLHQVGTQVLIRQAQLAPFLLARKHRARLNDQVIHREMGGPQGQGLLQLLVPVGEHLGGGPGTGNRGTGKGRQPLDQVQAPAAQGTPPFGGIKPCGGFNHIGAPMAPPQGRQHPIVQALPPQADAVDAGGQPAQ